MKILVAVDGSVYTKRMLAYLAAHDEWLGAAHDYTVLHASPNVPARAAKALDKAALQTFHDNETEKVFKPIRQFFRRQGIDARWVGKVGAPADVIATAATKGGYDLLVMGSHGHGRLANLVMGSVATSVLARCTTPILLVR